MIDIELAQKLNDIERRLDRMAQPEVGVTRLTTNVSNPPTDAELDGALGSPANFYGVAVIDDAGGGTTWWLIVSDGTVWLYEQLSKAV